MNVAMRQLIYSLISVEDTTAPTLVSEFETSISAECTDIPEVPELVFEDACSSTIDIDYVESQIEECTSDSYEIYRTWTVTDECGNSDVFEQIVSVNVPQLTGSTTSLCKGDNFDFDLMSLLSGDHDGQGSWEDVSGDVELTGSTFNPLGLAVGEYTFIYRDTACEGCPRETFVFVDIHDLCIELPCILPGLFEISKAVTPNGDQHNEYFEIKGLDPTGGCSVDVQMFNRWGAMIYEQKNYQNDWNGFSHSNSAGSHDKVPTGTYYYIINLNVDGENVDSFTGYIYVGTK